MVRLRPQWYPRPGASVARANAAPSMTASAPQATADVTRGADASVGDDVDVPAARLVEVVTTGGGDIGHRRGHRRVDPERLAGRAALPAEADEHPSSARAHQVQGRRVGGGAAHDDGHVELVDEPLEVERLRPTGDVLGGHRRTADDEEVDPRVDNGLPVLLGALRRQARPP